MSERVCADAPFVQDAAEILTHAAASARYWYLRLRCPAVARRATPGQFVMLACQPSGPRATDPLLPRPLALLDADPSAGTLDLLYFVAGRGTECLRQTAERAVAEQRRVELRILGPLGRGFEPVSGVEAHIGIGGGSGVAPLVFLFRHWLGADAGAPRHLILAARTKGQLVRDEYRAVPGAQLHDATDDGSAGFAGNAVACLHALLETPGLKGRRVALYTAGPEPMMLGAASLARARSFPCRVSLEARMACGVGVCRGCVVDALAPHPKTGLRRRAICQDGPVFDAAELAGPWSGAAHA